MSEFSIALEFKPQDCWVGAYWETKRSDWNEVKFHRHVWICLLPMVPIHISWRAPHLEPERCECGLRPSLHYVGDHK